MMEEENRTIEEIHTEDLDIELEEPIKVKVEHYEDYTLWRNNELKMWVIGQTEEELKKEFYAYFQFLYDIYYKEDDSNLAKYGKKTKENVGRHING